MSIKIGSYCITHDCLKSNLPFEESIRNHLGFCDFVGIVDTSSDGTWHILEKIRGEFPDRVFIWKSEWNYNNPAEMGRQKTMARKNICGVPNLNIDYLWQNDIDEFLHEKHWELVHKLIRNHPTQILFDIPCVTLHGGMKSSSLRENTFWKWRLSKNLPWIIHGVPKDRRLYDGSGKMFFYREDSDSCEFLDERTLEIIPSTIMWNPKLLHYRRALDNYNKAPNTELLKKFKEAVSSCVNSEELPCVLHYSWVDPIRKFKHQEFWNKMARYHKKDGGKRAEASTKNIDEFLQEISKIPHFSVDIKEHPVEIMEFALSNRWPQAMAFAR